MRSFYLLVQIYSEFTPYLPSELCEAHKKVLKTPPTPLLRGEKLKLGLKLRLEKDWQNKFSLFTHHFLLKKFCQSKNNSYLCTRKREMTPTWWM